MLELVGLAGLGAGPARSAVGRHAAARRPGPGAGHRPGGPAVRRAVLRPRPADPARHAGRGRPPARARSTRRWCSSPTTCRGAAPRRPHRHHARRPVRAGRHPGRGGRRRRPTTTSADFVRDVSRVARGAGRVDHDAARRAATTASPRVPLGTKVRDVLGRLARSDLPVGVVDDGGERRRHASTGSPPCGSSPART